ncbi:MAG: HYR domain-containing protein [Owenweeksia sp.]|nr:HYR domain-containing protein [Owenweeksia sp.]
MGSTTINYSTTDPSGNSQVCNFKVTVEDHESPTALCQNMNVQLDASGQATIMPQQLDGGSSDGCSSVSFSASKTLFTTADIGTNNVTLTITDSSGNSSTCKAIVTVSGMADSSYCPNDIVTQNDSNGCTAAVTYHLNIDSSYSQTTSTTAHMPSGNISLNDRPKHGWHGYTSIDFNPSGVPGSALGGSVKLKEVYLEIKHKRVADLVIDLVSPNGTSVRLIERPE